MFTAHPEYSDITPTQYEAAYNWLRKNGLLDDVRNPRPVHDRVFRLAVSESGSPWFTDADLLIRDPGELPQDALMAAKALELTADEAFAHIQSVWGKVDTARREQIGLAGELTLVELLTAEVPARIEHVAAHSDGYGYDIAVHANKASAHIEAKATMRRGRLTLYLSRNEYETMRRDPAWQLVAVRLTADLALLSVATVPREWIVAQVPVDPGLYGRWESCRLEVPPEVPEKGIPALLPLFAGDAPAKIAGTAAD
ncbi:protein NO VEIN domain-containing protein [Streptomyces sp. Je 1-369]|uniref:protein NO VEIN domain-containing protein n=1 Tax=Streptomyces sp. Je 1-369 TaxID=2966192 RepID=UPI002285C286|nr:DUF3883 domain-containing protein [Streptomyces sp. Je 1-369]WAL95710.1 DUF3883 domain-containing protein [Streptomyces sp. Je 1-369]